MKIKKILSIILVIVIVLLLPSVMVSCNTKSGENNDELSTIAGHIPFAVNADDMNPEIMEGDIIYVKELTEDDKENLKIGDIITFYDPASNGNVIITRRIMEKEVIDGKTYYTTAGDYNIAKCGGNAENKKGYDTKPVSSDSVIGLYTGTRIPVDAQ